MDKLVGGIDPRAAASARIDPAQALEASTDIVACFDSQGRHLYVNQAVRSIGLAPDDLLGRTNEQAGLPREHCAYWNELIGRAFASGEAVAGEFSYRGPRGEHWFSTVLAPQRGVLGEVEVVWGITREVTGYKRRQAELADAATQDPLTGVANRRAATTALGEAPDAKWALLFVDLDDFGAVNSSAGHLVGDKVLAAVARRIQGAVRPEDLVARWGGDEFIVLCGGLSDEEASAVGERVLASLREPVAIDGHEITASATVGVAAGGIDLERLIAFADNAMREGKADGKGVVRLSPD